METSFEGKTMTDPMPAPALSNSMIVAAYREKTPTSERLARDANNLFPSGITHDSRHVDPYGLYVERAEGARKWDVDGNEYVDYFGGHGALLLGHNHPEVLTAIHDALDNGSHFGANHTVEIAWAEAVKTLMPGVERLRFTSSGTEATHLALRLARAHTGRSKIVRLNSHFHGWHDHMAGGAGAQVRDIAAPGVLAGIAEQVVLLPPGDIAALEAVLAGDDDIAAVIFEPTGAYFGVIPLAPDYVAVARELCTRHGAVLIFDEVVTGFRVAPGGAQEHLGVTPDLTALAKILAGGLPGGAVVGRKDILDRLDFDATRAAGVEKIAHHGTFKRQSGRSRGRCRGARHHRLDRRLRASQRGGRESACWAQRGARERRRAMGVLRRLLGRPPVHQPGAARCPADPVRRDGAALATDRYEFGGISA